MLLRNEFQSTSSLDVINRESQQAGQSYTFVNICVINIVLFIFVKNILFQHILYQKAYTLNLSDIISALRNVTIFVIVELPYAFHTSM